MNLNHEKVAELGRCRIVAFGGVIGPDNIQRITQWSPGLHSGCTGRPLEQEKRENYPPHTTSQMKFTTNGNAATTPFDNKTTYTVLHTVWPMRLTTPANIPELDSRVRGSSSLTPISIAVFRDGFTSGLGWMIFQRDSAGRVVGVNVSGDRVWNLRFTRQP
jgi:hypothetical protein